jgi:hypothetical protein
VLEIRKCCGTLLCGCGQPNLKNAISGQHLILEQDCRL